MWARDLIRLPILLSTIIGLLREQNALLRELIQFHTKRPPQTPSTIPSPTAGALGGQPRQPIRRFTQDDVFVMTPARRVVLDLEEQARREIPWRGSTGSPSGHPVDEPPPT